MAHKLEKITIEIETTNAAFDDASLGPDAAEWEVGRILLTAGALLRGNERPHTLKDFNGNTVGRVVYHQGEGADDE